MLKNYKIIITFIAFYLLILSSSILLVAYLPISYQINYELNNQEYNDFKHYTNELINYFLYSNDLDNKWSQSEQKHYNEVRQLYTILFLILLFSIYVLRIFKEYLSVRKFSIISLVLLYSHLLIFIDFQFFWDKVFHPLLFSNSYWIIKPGEISYELFSYRFFINSIIFIIIINSSIHLSIIFKDKMLNYYKTIWNHFK